MFCTRITKYYTRHGVFQHFHIINTNSKCSSLKIIHKLYNIMVLNVLSRVTNLSRFFTINVSPLFPFVPPACPIVLFLRLLSCPLSPHRDGLFLSSYCWHTLLLKSQKLFCISTHCRALATRGQIWPRHLICFYQVFKF